MTMMNEEGFQSEELLKVDWKGRVGVSRERVMGNDQAVGSRDVFLAGSSRWRQGEVAAGTGGVCDAHRRSGPQRWPIASVV